MTTLSVTVAGYTAEIEIPTQAVMNEYHKYVAMRKAIIDQQQIVAAGLGEETKGYLDVLDGLLTALDAAFPDIPRVTIMQE